MREFARSLGQLITALLLVAAGGVLGAGLVVLMNDGTYLRATDKFDIFINVLFVTFGILTVVGFAIYNVVRGGLQSYFDGEVKKLQEERISQIYLNAAVLFANMAYAHWRESEELWRANEFRKLEDDLGWKRKIVVGWKRVIAVRWIDEQKRILLDLDLAIREAEHGLGNVALVTPQSEDEEYLRWLTLALKNTLAYLLATRRSAKDLGTALELEEEVRKGAGSDYGYLETSSWVLMRFGELYPDEDRTERGRQIIRDILARGDIEDSWRKDILEKYERCFPKAFESL